MDERENDDDKLRSLQSRRNSWVKVEDTREPSLAREIGKVALLFAKVAGAMLSVLAVLYPIFSWNPVAGIWTFYGLLIAGMIVQCGYWGYRSLKKDHEWRKQRQEDTARWEEASKRPPDGKTP
jgi:protein-S-isoprenylcysteine O-methyltransferase Ste14